MVHKYFGVVRGATDSACGNPLRFDCWLCKFR
jgi:hypothetical protein